MNCDSTLNFNPSYDVWQNLSMIEKLVFGDFGHSEHFSMPSTFNRTLKKVTSFVNRQYFWFITSEKKLRWIEWRDMVLCNLEVKRSSKNSLFSFFFFSNKHFRKKKKNFKKLQKFFYFSNNWNVTVVMVSSLTREYVTPANTTVANFCKLRMMHRDCFFMGDDECGIEYGMSFLEKLLKFFEVFFFFFFFKFFFWKKKI